MPTTVSNPDSVRQEVNELYWNSDQTVDQILGRLGIGKRLLYASLRPIPAGAACPNCSDRMVFANRSSRDAGRAVCRTCGTEAEATPPPVGEVPLEQAPDGWGGDVHRSPVGEVERAGAWSRWREDLSAVEPQRAALVGGAAALGVVLGAVAARRVREIL